MLKAGAEWLQQLERRVSPGPEKDAMRLKVEAAIAKVASADAAFFQLPAIKRALADGEYNFALAANGLKAIIRGEA
jgi:hypothetical protein